MGCAGRAWGRVGCVVLVVTGFVSACFAPNATTAAATTWCGDRSSIVVLGDSHSTGWGLPDYTGNGDYAQTEAGWVSTLKRRASTEWGTVTTVLARNGATAADFHPGGRWPETAAAIDTVGDLHPPLVVIALGGNEFAQDMHPARFDEHYRGLVHEVSRVSPRTTVLLVMGPEMGARLVPDPTHSWNAYVGVAEAVAADEGVGLLDLGEYLPAGGTAEAEGLYLPDDAHLTAAGHRVVHAAVWTRLSMWCGA